MVFYFTGTGNSRWVAEALGKAFEEPLVSIAEVLKEEKNEYVYPLGEKEKVFFVFPVHSWGPAVLVPFLKSYLVYPLFVNFAIGSNKFYATDACISCGICAKICPTGTIALSEDGKPKWANTCVQCVACIHRCPVRAIEYGKISLKKGRYHHPEFK